MCDMQVELCDSWGSDSSVTGLYDVMFNKGRNSPPQPPS